MMKILLALFLPTIGLFGHVVAGETKPYPLQTCIVSDEPLEASRHPISVAYNGQEVRVCCRECKAAFLGDPEKFLKKIPAGN
jgi:hypothetical protein